ncbi:MAG TPA: hypothetical protein V6D03_04810 [Candidatus Caenarcaniphilales bacterium]
MNRDAVLKKVERYQTATSQQERDNLLYQVALSSNIFTAREIAQIAERRGTLSEQQRQRVLGYVEVYFNLDLGRS